MFTKLLKPQPRRRHRVAHRAAHHAKRCEIGGVVEILRSEDMSDDQVVGETVEGFLRGGLVRIGRNITARESIGVLWRIGGHRGGCRVRVVVFRGFPEKRYSRSTPNIFSTANNDVEFPAFFNLGHPHDSQRGARGYWESPWLLRYRSST